MARLDKVSEQYECRMFYCLGSHMHFPHTACEGALGRAARTKLEARHAPRNHQKPGRHQRQ